MSYTFWAIIALLSWGVSPILDKFGVLRANPSTVMFLHSLTVAGSILLIQLFRTPSNSISPISLSGIDAFTLLIIVGSALLGGLVGEFAYLQSLEDPFTARAVAITSAYPLITVATSFIVLQERVSTTTVCGAALIVAGIALLAAQGETKSSSPEGQVATSFSDRDYLPLPIPGLFEIPGKLMEPLDLSPFQQALAVPTTDESGEFCIAVFSEPNRDTAESLKRSSSSDDRGQRTRMGMKAKMPTPA